MLGLIHRSVMEKGPNHFAKFFVLAGPSNHPNGRDSFRRHNRQLTTHRRGQFLEILSHSALGLIDIYNLLPQDCVDHEEVSIFQGHLQSLLVIAMQRGTAKWGELFSPRSPLHIHPLRQYRTEILQTDTMITTPCDPRDVLSHKCIEGWLRFAS